MLADGRVVERANINLKDVIAYDWQCVCPPEQNHDHDKFINLIASGLANREQVIAPLAVLVGQTVQAGTTTATITDCNIQILGPMSWRTYAAWQYADGTTDSKTYDAEDPLKSPAPAAVQADITAAVTALDVRLAAAAALASFAGEVSQPDPTQPPPVIVVPPDPVVP